MASQTRIARMVILYGDGLKKDVRWVFFLFVFVLLCCCLCITQFSVSSKEQKRVFVCVYVHSSVFRVVRTHTRGTLASPSTRPNTSQSTGVNASTQDRVCRRYGVSTKERERCVPPTLSVVYHHSSFIHERDARKGYVCALRMYV